MSIDEIWKIDDVNRFIVALTDRVGQKCDYGDKMDALSEAERTFFITETCEMEINNGGFAQFFDNSSGDLASETVSAFCKIGAMKTAQIVRAALSVFGRELPSDREERMELLDELACDETDDALYGCDTAFLKYEEDLNSLNYAYVLKNRADFS